jgi:phosphoserine phosphatase RsbU/P
MAKEQPGSAGRPSADRQRFSDRLRHFWQQVTEGLELQVLWAQFSFEARSSYSLYTREIDWDALKDETRFRRCVKICRALFLAMLMKLSPARRVFLLIALVLALMALSSFQVEVGNEHTVVGLPQNGLLVLLSVGGLLFLLALELADRVTMKRDLEIAREIQRWLVPEVPPKVLGADIAFLSRPANTVGGDYCDAFVLDKGEAVSGTGDRLLLVVADVAGKSVPASLLMATFQASLRTLATPTIALRDLVMGINRYACANSLGGRRFTTAFFSEFNSQTRNLIYINAGHNAPIVRRASGALERLDVGGLPLGIESRVQYESASVVLAPGDLLIIFTDGLIETMNAAEEEFGEERLLNFVKATPAKTADEILRSLVASADAFSGSTPHYDDLTCMILRSV